MKESILVAIKTSEVLVRDLGCQIDQSLGGLGGIKGRVEALHLVVASMVQKWLFGGEKDQLCEICVKLGLHLQKMISANFDHILVTQRLFWLFKSGFWNVEKVRLSIQTIDQTKFLERQVSSRQNETFRVFIERGVLWVPVLGNTVDALELIFNQIVDKDSRGLLAD